ncbi:MAG: ABC transporter ATP-binding protein [Candidatus Kariarchaeaceae archaeon]|jgi:putative ABC transport system ATP-binding protein
MKYLSLEKVSTKIKDKLILQKISCNFPKSKISVIIGRSGAGKSTLLRTITRFWEYSGTIYYNNTNLRDIPANVLRKEIGYVGQIPIAFNGSVRDNITFPRQYHKMKFDEDLITNLTDMVGLDRTLLEQDAKTLSVGQKQRLHLARTLANEPTAILLDEPASALDVISKSKFEDMIINLKTTNPDLTIIIVTHDLNQARNIGDHLILLEKGELIVEEGVTEFFAQTLVGDAEDKDGKLLENLIEKLTGGST